MIFGKLDKDHYMLRLEPGEEIVLSIKQFCIRNNVKNANFCGIGSVVDPKLAHYQLSNKEFKDKSLSGTFEITNVAGNVGAEAGEIDDIIVHAHITVADEEMKTYGGHLISGFSGATCEIVIQTYPSNYQKSFDDEVGLKVYRFDIGG
jgi:predicted DNA-binding protein with PD1-like motif